jgi:predicted RNase H-like HicB family nuclease
MAKSLTYTLTIESHPEDGGYLAYFPALPGCHTWGESYEQAVRNAEEVLVGYLEALQMISNVRCSGRSFKTRA